MKYVMGIDFGGGSGKATLLNEKGAVVATANSEYPTFYGEGGKAEQRPEDWIHAACENIRNVLAGVRAEDVECLCFDAATHTAVLTDGDYRPLDNAIYWTDTRCLAQKDALERQYGDKIFDVCKHRVDTLWTLPQLLWIRENRPGIYEKTRHVLFAKDYVRHFFTGDSVTDYIEAQGSMLADFEGKKWDDGLLGLAGLTERIMPEIVRPLDVVGTVSAEAAARTGLCRKTRVICGATDTAMEVFAAGGLKEGDTTVKLATAGRICVVSRQCVPDRNIVNYSHLKEGLYYPGSATKSCAASLRWFRDAFGGNYAEYDEAAAKIPVGSEGLIFHPYLTGELTPYANPRMRGSFFGVGADHTKGHFIRSVMEGVALSLYDCRNYLEERGVRCGKTAFCIGGGAKSALWRQIVADALGTELITTANNDSSFGSAMCAGVAAGFFRSPDEAAAVCRRVTGRVKPNPENAEKYRETYRIYRKIAEFSDRLSYEQ